MAHTPNVAAFLLLCKISLSYAAYCEILAPISGESGAPEIGVIMIPGANYAGELYIPLAQRIQEVMPSSARVWFGITEGWLIDTPNPLEIAGAINDCKSQAEDQALGGTLYLAGHSLGGVMLEQYLQSQENMAAFSGVLLFGSYLTDFILGDSNSYGVPALTVIGGIDGLSLSYAFREWMESEATGSPDEYPVYIADRVNHAQVGSGDVPAFVKDRDIPAELSDDEAHTVYANIAANFLILQNQAAFDAETIAAAVSKADELKAATELFLGPMIETSLMESDGQSSSWMVRGQQILSEATMEDGMEVIDIVVPFEDLGDFKPSVVADGCNNAKVYTCSQAQFDLDLADADTLHSAKVIKAKFKIVDTVREELCMPAIERKQCRDINEAALAVALELASEDARQRYERIGTKLFFLDDSVSPWGPGWEFSSGLHYKNVNSTHTSLYSTSLISEPDFIIASAAGMHYCDLLSPYRALEWIYISSVVGK